MFSFLILFSTSFVVSAANEETPVYTRLSALGVDYALYGLTTYMSDEVESWTVYSDYALSTSSLRAYNTFSQKITGVNEDCKITEIYKYYSNNAVGVFESGTSYQLYIPVVKYIKSSSQYWYPRESLYAPDCTVRAYIAPEIFTDFDAVCEDTISDTGYTVLSVSVPVLDADYYALEVRLTHCATGCYINSGTMLYEPLQNNVEIYYFCQNSISEYPQYRVLSELEQEEIFSGSGSGGSSGSSVDLSETNSLISKIKEGIQNVIDAIVALPAKIWDTISTGLYQLFVPSEEALTAFKDDMLLVLSEHFGAVYESVEIIAEYFANMNVESVQEYITFPEIILNLGAPFTIGGWQVKVVPDGFDVLFDALKWAIDAICTIAFINTMRERFDDVIVGGEQSVD